MTEHGEQVKETQTWFTAISSIIVTSQLKTYFHLSNEAMPLPHSSLKADRPQFKNFCRLNAISKKTFFELHNLAFKMLFRVWKNLFVESKD